MWPRRWGQREVGVANNMGLGEVQGDDSEKLVCTGSGNREEWSEKRWGHGGERVCLGQDEGERFIYDELVYFRNQKLIQ